ncbi:MAG: hypothetical protein HEQ22_00780 [Sphingopyxis sp.]|uniref:hypothetical protein n=1 Tax=Sphingopyxis sp. TaxID=1908224 RepID=UPI003D80AFF5
MTTVPKNAAAKRRKTLLAMGVGAIAGGAGMMLLLTMFDRAALPDPDPSRIATAGIGLIYALMGVAVGLGVLAPRAGARILNVEDADELREQRAILLANAVGCIAMGAALMLLGVAAGAGAPLALGQPLVFALLIAALIVASVAGVWCWPRYDELMRSMAGEGAAAGGYLIFFALVLWGGAAATGLAALPGALDLLSIAFGFMLIGCFVAVGRRGMLEMR